MRIHKLSIEGFGRFNDVFTLDFSNDIALVVGDNETGKSTLLRAIGAVLFGFKYEEDRVMFAPSGAASPRAGTLEMESCGTLFRFKRDFASNHACIEEIGTNARVLFDGSAKPGGRTEEKESYDALMRRLIGIDDEDLFENSVFVEQNSLRPEMEGVARQIVSGTVSADFVVALDNLKQECESLSLEVPWGKKRKPRRIELLQSELLKKKNMLSDVRNNWTGIDEDVERLRAARNEFVETGNNIAEQKSWEKDLTSFSLAREKNMQLERQINECRRHIRDVETLTSEVEEYIRRIRKEYSEYESVSELAEDDIARTVQFKMDADELEERRRQAAEDVPRFRLQNLRPPAILLILDLAFLVLSILAGFGSVFAVILILAGLAIMAWPIVAGTLALKTEQSIYENKLIEINDQLDSLRRRSTQIEDRHSILKGRDPSKVLSELREFRQLVRQKEKKEEALKQHPSLEELRAQYDSISNNYVMASRNLEELTSQRPRLLDVERKGSLGNEIEDARNSITSLESKLQKLEKEEKDLEIKIATTEAKQTISEESLLEEIAETESALEQLRLSRDAHLMAIKVLEEAVSEFRSDHLVRIEKKTSDYLQRITDLPCDVKLDEKLDPIGVERENRLFRPGQLSQGTRDQLYFALRIASVEEISGHVRLPMLLDDPFVNFDEHRLRAALDMLSVISESHQVVLFTHDRRLCDWRRPSCILKDR